MIKTIKFLWIKITKSISLGTYILLLIGCVTPFDGVPSDFEEVLVVESIITQEYKKHEVFLSRSYPFGGSFTPEKNAVVQVNDDRGNTYTFEEKSNGKYIASVEFSASQTTNYTLNITTVDGKNYESKPQSLITSANLDRLYAEKTYDDFGREGIGIYIDSYDPSSKSKLYRFDFEETYKIVAPLWSPYDAVVVNEGRSTFDLSVILREREEQVCFGYGTSSSIILNNTLGLSEDRLEKFQVHFIRKDDPKLQHRYSILVRQYVQSKETYSFFETLQGLSQGSENIFSEDQPGFIEGNIFNTNNSSENIAGYFQVSSTDEERIFLNFNDFFEGSELPPYFNNCNLTAPITDGTRGNRPLLNLIYQDEVRFYQYNFGVMEGGPFIMVSPECGDCTTFGSNKKPSFWVE